MTEALAQAVGLIGWDAAEEQWLAAREGGISASDVKTALGFDPHKTPWELWAEKTGAFPTFPITSRAIQLGRDLEPWLMQMAARELRQAVTPTPYRLYAHPEHTWRMASPDGITANGDLVEGKTAGLCGGYGIPDGWSEHTVPLGHNLQARWQMHVLDAPRVFVAALVAGLGFRLYLLERDLAVEADLVEQVEEWYQRHILEGEEPPFGAVDADALLRRYPQATKGVVALDGTEAYDLWLAYRSARTRERQAAADKKAAADSLKALIGEHETATVGGHVIATWKSKEGIVNWKRLAEDLAAAHNIELPPINLYRSPSTRTFLVKGLNT